MTPARAPWTSVVSYHTDPESCGVAKFSAQLASRLGVPFVAAHRRSTWGENPLLSVKFAEWCPYLTHAHFDQLWHDAPLPLYASQASGGRVWKLYEIGVPALVERVYMSERALFTFGMAHKIELDHFQELRRRVEPDDQLWISTAVHEGAGPSRVADLMTLWGPNTRNLGHLADGALSLVWPHCSAFVAFFAGGLRANNTSVHAALDARVPVITNVGPETPEDLRERVTDITHCFGWSHDRRAPSPYTWTRLLKELGCEPSR